MLRPRRVCAHFGPFCWGLPHSLGAGLHPRCLGASGIGENAYQGTGYSVRCIEIAISSQQTVGGPARWRENRAAVAMKREFGRDGVTLASASPLIISWDPLAGELLRGHLEAEGFPGTVVVADHDFAESSAPLVVLPPPTYAEFLGGAWDTRLRGFPLDVPMVVLARPTVPVRAALQLNLRTSGVALLDAGRASTVAAVPSALRMSLEGGQVIDPLFIPSTGREQGSELTPAELRVYELLASGRSNSGIAAELFLSERTVEVHVRKIFSKLSLSNDRSMNRRVVAALLQALPA